MKRFIIIGLFISFVFGALFISCNKDGCTCKVNNTEDEETFSVNVPYEAMKDEYGVKTCSKLEAALDDEVTTVTCK